MGAVALGLLVLVVVTTGAPAASPAVAASRCAHANARPGDASTRQLRRATLCLINKARAAQKLNPLSLDTDLTRMAKHHTKAMLAQDCLKHRCTGEVPLKKRLKRSGYLDSALAWAYAEDLGYESTPKQMVTRWLNTKRDAHNILRAKYAQVGIAPGAGSAAPGVDDSRFVTYTLDLGWRKLSSGKRHGAIPASR